MKLQTFFSELASRGPLLIRGKEVYLVSPNYKPNYKEGNKGNHRDNYIGFSGSNVKLGLVPAGNLDDLVRFYNHINEDEIFALKKAFIESKVDKGFQTAEQREREIGDRKLFSFIIKELMPYMSGHKEDLSALLGDEVNKQRKKDSKEVDEKELLGSIEEVKRKLYAQQQDYAKKNFNGTAKDEVTHFLDVIQGKNILTLGEKVYQLANSNGNQSQLEICLNGVSEKSELLPLAKVENIEKNYSDFLEWTAKIEAIDEFSDYIKDVQRTRLKALKDFDGIIKLKEFNDGDVGFLRKDGSVYVYQIIPPFAMLDPRPTKKGVCYEFPRLRVGLRIQYDGDIYLDKPELFEPEWHPFTSNKNQAFQGLCGGNVPSRNGSNVEWVAKALDDAKNLIMHGLTPHSIRGHGGDERDGGEYFGDSLDKKLSPRKTTIEKAKKKGLLITNRWDWNRG
ncbi:MAG: hypothetical protein KKF46_01740 [Nanoarchaeota archaeon]|nr:hypothetical protein [Nanoarchaeota archaeon]MBU1321054.1 hypothetical protein [Nanoarchaeota archaeon]MBU1598123.1 hypothetical protein [Nanoarchaeota archaeon]MBU2442313.1 hypothetical protein [Nanoarchaeota archaeon]